MRDTDGGFVRTADFRPYSVEGPVRVLTLSRRQQRRFIGTQARGDLGPIGDQIRE